MSLRRKFLAVFVSFAVLLAAAGGFLSWTVTSRTLEAQLDDNLIAVAVVAAETGFQANVVLSFTPGDERLSPFYSPYYNTLRRLQRWVDAAYIFDRENRALVTTEGPTVLPIGTPIRWLDAYERGALAEAWRTGRATTDIFEGDDGRFYKYGFVQLEQSDAMLGVLIQADYLAPLLRFRRNLVLGSLGAVLLAILFAGYLAGNVTRPLERLARVALRIQRGRLDEPVVAERGDELGRLSRAMERMRKGIVQRDEQLRLMLAQVAHEIRNPLGGLELFASAAADTEDPTERRRLLRRVRDEVQALNQIISDFLTFARPLRPVREIHDVREPVEDAAELVEAEIRARGGIVTVDLPARPLMARADPEQVKRVVLNLLRNGAEAGGTVQTRAEWVGGEVRIVVADDGGGIPESIRERIFEPFVTDKEKGAGLGLAIVQRLVKANGGRVRLVEPEERELGTGAEFHVYLPGSDEFPDAGPRRARGSTAAAASH